MTDMATWQENNDKYLTAALAWLRLCLQRLAASGASTVSPPRRSGFLGLGRRKPAAPPVKRVRDSEIADAARVMEEAAATDPPPFLLVLGRRFGLLPFEQEVLLLCAAMELDTRVAGLCALAQDNANRPYPTFALALALFEDRSWEVLSPERPLRFWRMIEINQAGAQPLTTSPLRADERMANYIKGLNYLDDRLSPLLIPFDVAGIAERTLPASQQAAVSAICYQLERAAGPGQVVQLVGPNRVSKQLVAVHTAAALKREVVRLPAESFPSRADELDTLARLWERESVLLPIALYLDAHEELVHLPTAEGQSPSLHRFLARCSGLVFLDTQEVRPGLGRYSLAFDVDKPTPAEQQAAWAAALGPEAGESPGHLAGQFNLNLPTIELIAQMAQPEEEGADAADVAQRAWSASLVKTRPHLDVLAQRLEPIATWDDIVLPDAERTLLEQISSQVRQRSRVYDDWGFRQKMNRGLGISTLFAGQSGTGKTMAAEVIANQLALNLYRIDLSAVVSKYIGETEKNLRRLFDAAEDGGAILFFDEADALFGKRSEVKDSHDRYANIEINYLLQRMEAYRGLAILATNMKGLLDRAFLRRLRFIVDFPFPGPQQRREIWQKVFPPQTPLEMADEKEKLDFERLSRFNLTGGNIHAIALNAAFLAAAQGFPVTMSLVLQAAREEYRKLGKPVNEADFKL
jgi:hypothetical protein